MRSDRSGERLACPHCRANNFVGQAQCWQCHGSLPPPEEINLKQMQAGSRPVHTGQMMGAANQQRNAAPNIHAPAPAAQYMLPIAPRAHSKKPIVLCIALLTAGVLIWAGMRYAGITTGTSRPSSGESAEIKRLRAEGQGVVSDSELPNSGLPDPSGARLAMPPRDPLATGTDPNELAAKRAIEQAMPHLGLPPSSTSDGKVHLRNGDTISNEQYEEVQRKLRQNPALDNHTPVPRL